MKAIRPRFTRTRMVAALAVAGMTASVAPALQAQEAILEEVIVTARKVVESMQSVPVAVSAFSGQTIDELLMRDIRDMEGMIPNFIIAPSGVAPAGATVFLRGVGFQDVERSFDPAVGAVMDGVPLSFVNGAMANTFDFAALEVLRGPQGTLFGRNTTGGVINISRTTPTGELGLKYELTAGEDDRQDIKLVGNFPIVKGKLAGKLGFAQQKDGGQRKTVDGKQVGDADNKEYTATVLWTPVDDFEAKFTYVRYEDDNDGVVLGNLTSRNENNAVNPEPEVSCIFPLDVAFGQCGDDSTTGFGVTTQDYLKPIDFEWNSYTLAMDWDIGIGTITSITGYQDTDEFVPTDFDGSGLNFFHADRDQDSEQTTTELRFASSDELSDTWDFVAGVFYLTDEYHMEQNTSVGAFGGPDAAIFQNPFAHQERDAWAVFGEFHYALNEKWNLTLGGRYTEEDKDYDGVMNVGGGGVGTGYVPGSPTNDLWIYGEPIFFEASRADGDESWDEFTPKVGVDYQLNDDVMLFASYTEGFRSGGFNGRNTTADSIGPYEPEYVDSYEVGMKGDFLDSTLRANISAFYIDYDDKQEELIQPDDFGGSNTVVKNAATVETYGVEAELTWVASQNLVFNGNVGYLDASYDKYIADINGNGEVTDNSHLDLRRVPEWTAGLNGTYTRQIGPGVFTAFVNYRYTDDYWVEAANDPRGQLDSQGIVDANIAYQWNFEDGRNVRITAYGRDITDEESLGSAVVIPGVIAFTSFKGGSQYGVQVSGNF
jgi:iron complex outermembrane receptor protein